MGRLCIELMLVAVFVTACTTTPIPQIAATATPTNPPTPTSSPETTEPTGALEAEALTVAFSQKLYRTSQAKHRPDKLSTSLSKLARKIVQGKKTEQDKAIAIYDWLTENIAYDVSALDNGDLSYKTPDSIVLRRKGVCSGFAELFHLFCQEAGLESKIILGRSRADDQGLPAVLRDSPVNHAWNAVKIAGVWKLVDPTWGAGHINAERKFVKSPSKEWLFVPPEIFLYTHLPREEEWQFVERPIDREKFDSLPALRPLFFAAGYELVEPKRQPVRVSGSTTFKARSHRGNLLTAFVFQDGQAIPPGYVLPHQHKGQSTVAVRFPKRGEYTVYLVGRGASSPVGVAVATFQVISSIGEKETFPLTTPDFDKRRFQIIRGFTGQLRAFQKTVLIMKAPGASALRLEGPVDQPAFSKNDGFFEVEFTARKGSVKVVGEYPDSEQPVELVEYTVK
jgi:hypothetical protein